MKGSYICLRCSIVYIDGDLSVGIHVKEKGLANGHKQRNNKTQGKNEVSIRVGRRAIEVHMWNNSVNFCHLFRLFSTLFRNIFLFRRVHLMHNVSNKYSFLMGIKFYNPEEEKGGYFTRQH